jgi:hypothetical protein
VSLDEAGRGQSAGNRPIAILRLSAVRPEDDCQLTYISGDAQFVSLSLAAVNGTPVLTVTDVQSGEKGVINFVTLENRVRLEIDQAAAARNHLKLSSKLLDIALSPEGGGP